jgi:hypothetical protein
MYQVQPLNSNMLNKEPSNDEEQRKEIYYTAQAATGKDKVLQSIFCHLCGTNMSFRFR